MPELRLKFCSLWNLKSPSGIKHKRWLEMSQNVQHLLSQNVRQHFLSQTLRQLLSNPTQLCPSSSYGGSAPINLYGPPERNGLVLARIYGVRVAWHMPQTLATILQSSFVIGHVILVAITDTTFLVPFLVNAVHLTIRLLQNSSTSAQSSNEMHKLDHMFRLWPPMTCPYTRSIFYDILSRDTALLACEDELWVCFCEFEVWLMSWHNKTTVYIYAWGTGTCTNATVKSHNTRVKYLQQTHIVCPWGRGMRYFCEVKFSAK